MTDFIGFNTIETNFPPYTLTDLELVKRDLLNEFYTRLGERVMQPTFGTVIFDLLMEPADQVTKQAIYEDALRIVRKEPRLKVTDIKIDDFETGIILEIIVKYVPQELEETLYVTYQRNAGYDTTEQTING